MGELDQELQVAFMASWQVFFFTQCPPGKKRNVVFFRVSTVGHLMGDVLMHNSIMLYRMDDVLAEGQSEAPREVLICLLNLSSGGSN